MNIVWIIVINVLIQSLTVSPEMSGNYSSFDELVILAGQLLISELYSM